ncbi:hypothetical protein B0H19DRAFT_1110233 [Mycena capillaripes]|nr:hypothetical protein B0H19DRAFT_1110233 [Mycena capillaripes]
MSSAVELHARIAELSTAIELEKQVLRDLEASRSVARRDLNAIHDPIARLPLEISSDIFMHCLPQEDFPRPDTRNAPLLFLSIYHLWSNIALSTSSLWTTMYSESLDAANLETWLARARSLPLSISICGEYCRPEATAVVNKHAHQVQDFELSVGSPWRLETMTVPFPSLQKLSIRHTGGEELSFLRECMDILHAAPALVDCAFENMFQQHDIDVVPLTHSCLRRLRLGKSAHPDDIYEYGAIENTAIILKHLALPALEALVIRGFDISSDELSSFLTRSSPPLQSLHVATRGAGMNGNCLRSLSKLTDLALEHLETGIGEPPVVAMMATDHDFLPNIRSLTIRGWYPDHHHRDESQNLTSVLTARRTQLHSLWWWYDFPPDDCLLAKLRQLAQDGMNIYIGRHNHNYLSANAVDDYLPP